MKRKSASTTNKIYPIISILAILALWECLSLFEVVPNYMLPSPAQTVEAFIHDFGLLMSHLKVTLLDAQQKRLGFLEAVCEAAGVANAVLIHARAEDAAREKQHREQYDLAVARAVAPLDVLCEYLLPYVRVGGYALCWKGPAAEEELPNGFFAAQQLGGEMGEIIELFCHDTRHVIVPVKKNTEILPQYPRKNGIPAKRPLKCGKK